MTHQGFSELKLNLTRNQNETSVTCSPIMNTSFDVNLMTSSFIIYAQLIMQKKFKLKNCHFLTKFIVMYSFRLYP